MASGRRTLTLEIVSDVKRAADGIDSIEGKLGKFGKFATGAAVGLGGAFAAAGVGQFAADVLDMGSAVEESRSKLDVLLGSLSDQPKAWAKTAAEIGISEATALEAAGTFANLGNAIGLSAEESASWSTQLPTLAADLASFNNLDVDQAIGAIGAALRGEAEPIRQFGVLLDQATLEAIAYRDGIATVGDALTPAQKAQAAYTAIMEQTTAAQGDALRTADGWANQQRRLSAQFDNLKAQLGQAILPLVESLATFILEDVIPAFGRFADWTSRNWPKIWATIEPVVTGIRDLVSSVLGFLEGLWERYGERVSGIVVAWAKLVTDHFQGLVKIIAGVVELIGAIFRGDWAAVWDAARGIVQDLLDWLGDLGSNMARLIGRQLGLIAEVGRDIGKALVNALLSAWNSLDISFSIQIPSWVPGVGGRGWTVSDLIPDVPLLHAGGVTTREGLAFLDRQEAVIPLDSARAGIGRPINVYVDATLAQDPVAVGEAVRQALREYDAVSGF